MEHLSKENSMHNGTKGNARGVLNPQEMQFFNQLPVAVYTCDNEGFIEFYNEAAVDLWGRTPELKKELWCGFWKIYYPDGSEMPQSECPMAIALKTGIISSPEILVERPDGQRRHIIPHPKPLYDTKGVLIGAVNTLIDITDQVESRRKIEYAELHTRMAIEGACLGTFDWDLRNQVFHASPRLSEIFGFTKDEQPGHTELLSRLHPADKPTRDHAIADSILKGSLAYEARVIWPNRSTRWVKVLGKTMYDEQEVASRMSGTVLDITDLKQAGEKTRLSGQELEKKVKERTREIQDQNRFIQTLLDTTGELIIVIGPDLTYISMNRKAREALGISEGSSLSGMPVSDHALFYKNALQDDIQKALKGETVRRYEIKPGLSERFYDTDITPLRNDKGIYAVMLTMRDITGILLSKQEIVKAALDLKAQNNFVQTLIDSSVDMIIVLDSDLRFVSLNKIAETTFAEYFTESVVGKLLKDVDPTLEQKPAYADMLRCLNGEQVSRKDVKSNVKDSYYDLNYIPLINDGNVYAIMLITRDVTESVLTRQELERTNAVLKERNKLIETIIDSSQEFIAVYGADTTLLTMNKASERLLGRSAESMIGRKLVELFPAAKGTKTEQDLLAALSGTFVQNEAFVSPLTGRYIQNYLVPLSDESGHVYAALGVAHDVTHLKKAEEEIRLANQQLNYAQRLARIGSWKWDVENNIMTWSDEMFHIFNLDPAKYENTFENYLKLIYSEDIDLVKEKVDLALQKQVPFDFIHRMNYHDGTIHTLHVLCEVFTNANNQTAVLSGTAQDITESIEMELRLRQSEMRHHLMIDQVEDYAIIFLNTDGFIEDWNRGAQKIKGYTDEEIIGRHFSVFYTDADRRNNLPEKILGEARANKRSMYEGWRMRKDGSLFWASVLITALMDEENQLIGFSKLTRDLTDQKNAAEQIEKQNEALSKQNVLLEKVNKELEDQKTFAELLIESNPLMIMAYGRDEVVNTWNKKSEEMTGVKKEDMIGKNLFDVFPAYRNEKWIKASKDVLEDGKSIYFPRIQLLSKGGWGESFVIPLKNKSNQIIGLLSITKDISEIVEMSTEIANKNQALEKMNRELASFSYVASHDLQEPLRKILTFSSRLLEKQKDNMPEDALALLGKIEGAAGRMKILIQNLLEYSRLSNEEGLMETTDLNEVLQNVLNDFELLIEQKEATIITGKLPTLKAIPLQMNQLFYNLVSNALKFSKGEVKPRIEVSCRMLDDIETGAIEGLHYGTKYYEIIFKDNGIGFDQKFAEKIFVTFQRLNSANNYPGTGIGLALSKKIMEIHSGAIYANSVEHEGSEFHVILPVS